MNVRDAGVAFYIPTNKHSENNSDNENVQGNREKQDKYSFIRKSKWKIKYETSDLISTKKQPTELMTTSSN